MQKRFERGAFFSFKVTKFQSSKVAKFSLSIVNYPLSINSGAIPAICCNLFSVKNLKKDFRCYPG